MGRHSRRSEHVLQAVDPVTRAPLPSWFCVTCRVHLGHNAANEHRHRHAAEAAQRGRDRGGSRSPTRSRSTSRSSERDSGRTGSSYSRGRSRSRSRTPSRGTRGSGHSRSRSRSSSPRRGRTLHFSRSSSSSSSSDDDDGGVVNGPRPGSVPFFKQHLHTVVGPNNLTLLQVLYGALVLYLRDRWPVASVEALLRRDKRMLARPELIPTNFKTVQKVLGVSSWASLEYHFCDAKKCEGYLYPQLTKSEWHLQANDRCPRCSKRRFYLDERGDLQPRAWFIGFDPEAVFQSFFADSAFSDAWRAARSEGLQGAPPEGSWHAGRQFKRMERMIGAPFLDPNNGTWSIICDGFCPYNKVTHSCFVVALTNNDLPLDAYARTNNVRVVAIVPGPIQPNNIHMSLVPLLRVLRDIAGSRGAAPAPLQLQIAEADGSFTPLNHVPYLADIKGDRMAITKISGVKGPAACLSCHHCRNQGKRCKPNGTTVWRPAGYSKRVPQDLNFEGVRMYFDDERLQIKEREARRISKLARRAKRGGDEDTLKKLGRSGGCIVLDHLWYFSWHDGFPVSVVHALLHNVFGGFLRFALRKPNTAEEATTLTKAARKKLVRRGRHIIGNRDIGRTYKSIIDHLGLYTFEDYKNLALVYGKYLFRDDVFPPTLQRMYNNLCTAIEHYLTFGDFNKAARRRAHAALLSYAKQVESLPECEHLLTPSLHILLCRLRAQEKARGEVARDAEYVVERLMQELKRVLASKHIPKNLEKHLVNQLLLRTRERELLAQHNAALRSIEEMLDTVSTPAAVADRDGDQLPPGAGGCHMVGRWQRPRRRLQLVRATLLALFAGGEVLGGWTAGAVDAALRDRRVQIYHRATLGAGSGEVFSKAYGRQQTRNSNHVMVRFEEARAGRPPTPHICRVEFYVLVVPPGGRGNGGAQQQQQQQAANGLLPLRFALVKAFPAERKAPGMWRAKVDDATPLQAVLLEQIDCKLIMAARKRERHRRLASGTIYGMSYTTLSRIS